MAVVVDITISVDGFVTGPVPGPDRGLGIGGEALHAWALAGDEADRRVLDAGTHRTGAVVMGRRTFDIVDRVWSDTMGYGAGNAAEPPCFVVTHTEPEEVRLRDRFTVVTDGLVSALDQARAVAGERDVVVMGGGDLCGEVLSAGLADELSLHIAPIVLGAGTPLFAPDRRVELHHLATVTTANAVHVAYSVGAAAAPSASPSASIAGA